MSVITKGLVRAADLGDLQKKGYLTVQVKGHTIALFYHNDQVYAVDNRCPHMGFPLDQGTVKDGILTCHWHHARFDLASGGTFDQFADDVPSFPVHVQGNDVFVDIDTQTDVAAHHQERLKVGLERDISLVIGKAAIILLEQDPSGVAPFRTGLEFGTRYREMGWGQGLTMHVCFMNLLPHLAPEDRPRAMYHGLSAVARDCAGNAPRFPVRPLPDDTRDVATLKRWFRQFIEVRDAEGAERCVISAIRAGADHRQMADMLFSSVTDHRYIDTGHPADFTNKAFEALDIAGWDLAEPVLSSLVRGYADAARREESNAWRYPIDLVEILHASFEQLAEALEAGKSTRANGAGSLPDEELAQVLLRDDPQASVDALLAALRSGQSAEAVAKVVAYAAAVRIAQFHTSNEFGDWDTALHTFTFANAIHQGIRRAPSVELLRGVFDAAMSIYVDRFLNMPKARIPEPNGNHAANGQTTNGRNDLDALATLMNRQQQVNQSARQAADYLYAGQDAAAYKAQLGRLLLREDRDFHTIQTVESAIRQYDMQDTSLMKNHVLIAATRYLAAHAPTVRAQGQTYEIAQRLHRGERLFEG